MEDSTPSRALRDDQAGTLHVRQGGIDSAHATRIDVRQGGISRAQATDIAVVQGGIGIARGERVSIQMGGIGLAVTSDARVSRAFVRSIARDVSVEQAAVGTLAANHVTFQRRGLVLACRWRGEGAPRLARRAGRQCRPGPAAARPAPSLKRALSDDPGPRSPGPARRPSPRPHWPPEPHRCAAGGGPPPQPGRLP